MERATLNSNEHPPAHTPAGPQPDHTATRRTVWVDVEDLFQYFLANFRPSGIQRLAFEIMQRLPERAACWPGAPRIAFVRHTKGMQSLTEVTFASVAALFDADHRPTPPPRAVAASPKGLRLRIRLNTALLRTHAITAIGKLHPAIHIPLLAAGVHQLRALRHARALLRVRRTPVIVTPILDPLPRLPDPGFPGRSGDVFLVLGAPWNHPGYERLLQHLEQAHGLSAAILLYDLIPVRRPEWCASEVVASFVPWLGTSLPHFRAFMAISRSTAEDVVAFAAEIGLQLPGPVHPIPIGTSFGLTATPDLPTTSCKGLPLPGTYILFVSTLEARKNHALLFRIWCRLLAERPRDQVPTLIFAGRIGWLVADLMQQLENTNWLDGKIRMLREPTDQELHALYRGCLFTVFPSHFEGWGLPVTESLALGCPCLVSDRTSLPEAGGTLARYFDPDEFDDAYHAVRRILDDPAGLDTWRDQVRRDFQPVSWDTTADAVLHACLAPAHAEATP